VAGEDAAPLPARFGSLLDSVDLSGYYGPPGLLDEAIAETLVALADGPSAEWNAFADSLTKHRQRVLGRYAVRASMLALRTRERRHLDAGLLAHCAVTRVVMDWRDDLVAFAPYVHVARALGVDVPTLFDDAAAHAVPDLADVMQTFGRRTDVTLGAFGWRQVETPDGPTFEMMTLGGSPTGAVIGERSWNEVNEKLARELLDWVNEQRRRERE
jgi:hypothetical protein